MRHPGSGPQHTLSPQPSLTDGRGEREGGEEWGGGSGDCILTIPRSILSSLNLPSFLPSLYPIYPLFFLLSARTLLHPFNLSSIQFFTFSSLLFPLPPLHPSFACLLYFIHICYVAFPGLASCFRSGDLVRRETIPGGSRGVGSRLCPWSRCLTWLSWLSNPPVRGEAQGVNQGKGVRHGGQETAGQGRSIGATCPLKQTTSYTFSLRTFVCPSSLS